MQGFIANKSLIFYGVKYNEGDTIPPEAILPSRIPSLIRNKAITKITVSEETAEESTTAEETIENIILIACEDSDVYASPYEIIQTFEILQMKQDEAISAIAETDVVNVLTLVNSSVKSTAIKKAIKERLEALAETETDAETDIETDTGDETDSGGDE